MHMQDWVIKARIVRKYDLYVRRPEEDEEKKQTARRNPIQKSLKIKIVD